MQSEENQLLVSHPFPQPLEIARRDSHISTASAAVHLLKLKNKGARPTADLQAHRSMRICYLHFPPKSSDNFQHAGLARGRWLNPVFKALGRLRDPVSRPFSSLWLAMGAVSTYRWCRFSSVWTTLPSTPFGFSVDNTKYSSRLLNYWGFQPDDAATPNAFDTSQHQQPAIAPSPPQIFSGMLSPGLISHSSNQTRSPSSFRRSAILRTMA